MINNKDKYAYTTKMDHLLFFFCQILFCSVNKRKIRLAEEKCRSVKNDGSVMGESFSGWILLSLAFNLGVAANVLGSYPFTASVLTYKKGRA